MRYVNQDANRADNWREHARGEWLKERNTRNMSIKDNIKTLLDELSDLEAEVYDSDGVSYDDKELIIRNIESATDALGESLLFL